MAGARRKCVLFCLACTWAWTRASAGLGQEMFAAWAMDGMKGARVTEQQNYFPSCLDAPSIDLVVGVTLEICKIRIWPLGCREVFPNVKDLVSVYLLNSRRYKLCLCHVSLVQFPVEMMDLTHHVVPEKLLHLAFVATMFWWNNAKYVAWGSLQIKIPWKCILYIRFLYIPADMIAEKWILRRWKLVNAMSICQESLWDLFSSCAQGLSRQGPVSSFPVKHFLLHLNHLLSPEEVFLTGLRESYL